jgi:hypothetical protein
LKRSVIGVDFGNRDGWVLLCQAHGSHFGGHDVAFIAHDLGTGRGGDLEDHFSSVRQPDLVNGIEPALGKFNHCIVTLRQGGLWESPLDHFADLLPALMALGAALHGFIAAAAQRILNECRKHQKIFRIISEFVP